MGTLEVRHAGRTATVRRGTGHPDAYLYIDCDGTTHFLGVLEPGMTRRDVKRMAVRWLKRRAERADRFEECASDRFRH